jgi:hypothetical protein
MNTKRRGVTKKGILSNEVVPTIKKCSGRCASCEGWKHFGI